MEAGCDDVFGGGIGQKVARDLPDRELVERHVGVEGADHPVAIGPDRPIAVLLIPVGVGVAGKVEPAAGPAFAIPRAGEQSFHQPLIGIGRSVGAEGIEFGGRRRQADEIEMNAAAERGPVGLRARREPLLFEPFEDEAVDLVLRPAGLRRVGLGFRHGWPRGLLKRPVRRIVGAGGDPFRENPLFVVGERYLRVRRRHHEVGIGAGDPGDEFAVVRVARHDRPGAAVEFPQGLVAEVEPQAGLAVALVGAMALEAAVGEDRTDLPGEVGSRRGSRRGTGHPQQRSTHRLLAHEDRPLYDDIRDVRNIRDCCRKFTTELRYFTIMPVARPRDWLETKPCH